MGRRSDIDWHAIEVDYRAGVRSVRDVARLHEVSNSRLRERAKAEGWVRSDGEAARVMARAALAEAARSQAQSIGAQIGAKQAQDECAIAMHHAEEIVEASVLRGRSLRGAMSLAEAQLASLETLSAHVAHDVQSFPSLDHERRAHVAQALRSQISAFERWASAYARLVAIDRELQSDQRSSSSTDQLLLTVLREKEQAKH